MFDSSVFSVSRTIRLTSGMLVVGKDAPVGSEPAKILRIEGPGANLLAISGNGQGRVFRLAWESQVILAGISVIDGFRSVVRIMSVMEARFCMRVDT